MVGSPTEPGAQIGELHIHPIESDALVRSVKDVPVNDSLLSEPAGVEVPNLGDCASGGELLLGKLSDGFQQSITGVTQDLFRSHQ